MILVSFLTSVHEVNYSDVSKNKTPRLLAWGIMRLVVLGRSAGADTSTLRTCAIRKKISFSFRQCLKCSILFNFRRQTLKFKKTEHLFMLFNLI